MGGLGGSLAFGISDFAVGEGIYPAAALLQVARSLGVTDLVLWDRSLAGYPKLRHELAWAREQVRAGQPHPAFRGEGPDPEGFRVHLGCRFTWRGHELGALPHAEAGYAALNRLLTDQAHDREAILPGEGCMLLAETLAGLDALLREGHFAGLLGHPRRAQEARRALERGLPVVAPQVLRFRTPAGFELHRLKRALHACGTLTNTAPLWDPRDAAVPRAVWESRFPAAEPGVARATADLVERLRGWNMHWGAWVISTARGLEGQDASAVLEARVLEGLRLRYGGHPDAVLRRLAHELELIREMGFASYFLLVQDLVRGEGVGTTRICGRGSGAASLVSYALGLSNVDPIATNLMFERFLTRGRTDPPDLDIDFAWDEREAVIQRAFERYGRDRVAMVSNHVTFRRRSALRDVALAHGRPEAEIKAMSKRMLGWDGGIGDLAEGDPWRDILAQAQAIKGHFRQFSVHPGGVVITPGPFWEHAAVQPAAKEGVSVTQWDKDGVEGYGLVKIDLLGNRSLAVIRDAYDALDLPMTTAQAHLGKQAFLDIYGQQARTDPATQALLAKGDSIGVFYVESPATRQLQQRVAKGDFETLVIHSSLIRPASNRWIDTYVKRVRGEETYVPPHPVFADLLSESFGVLTYQEDVLKVCVALAGWTHWEADQLRKLLGKDNLEARLPLFEARFRAGCADRGIAPAVVDEAWSMIRTFRGYSFCKPHSASYAQVSFESAWIKAHHPAHFFASVITNQGGFYPAIAYLGDARRHRLVVRGPDVNRSAWAFRAEGEQALRVGLLQVKGAREAEVKALLAERDAKGPFADPEDLLGRVGLSLPTVEALCVAGAFDRWAPDGDRTRILWARLGGVPPGVHPRPTDPFDRADLELETLSLTLELHPAALARVRKGGGPARIADCAKPGQRLTFWALVVAEKVVPTGGSDAASPRGEREPRTQCPGHPAERGDLTIREANRTEWPAGTLPPEGGGPSGRLMQFVTLEDETGLVEGVAFPPAFARRRRPFQVGQVLPIRGRTTRQDGLSIFEVE